MAFSYKKWPMEIWGDWTHLHKLARQVWQTREACLDWFRFLSGGGYLMQSHSCVESESPSVLDTHQFLRLEIEKWWMMLMGRCGWMQWCNDAGEHGDQSRVFFPNIQRSRSVTPWKWCYKHSSGIPWSLSLRTEVTWKQPLRPILFASFCLVSWFSRAVMPNA